MRMFLPEPVTSRAPDRNAEKNDKQRDYHKKQALGLRKG